MTTKKSVVLGFILLGISLVLFTLHYLIFRDIHHLEIYTLHDLAFLPLEVLFVTLILDNSIENIQKKTMKEKMNMVIGTFFSEMGTDLLSLIVNLDDDAEEISNKLIIRNDWTTRDYKQAQKEVAHLQGGMLLSGESLKKTANYLKNNRELILRLLENPNLLEHEGITDLLWAVIHLTEELLARKDYSALSPKDLQHLEGDMMRAYRLLVREWLVYMKYLQKSYPYLFSLAIRKNPMDKNASVELM